MTQVETQAQHHRYSASGSEGWMTCAGKLAMEQGIQDTYSPYADEGSAAHFLAAECLLNNRTPESYHHFGIVCWEKPGERDGQCWSAEPLPEGAVQRSLWKVDNDMVKYVTQYTDYVRKQVKGGTLLVEQRVHFGGFIGVQGAFGTSDTVILSEDGTELIIVDLKYGFKEVHAERNSQMMLYALGVLSEAGEASLEAYIAADYAEVLDELEDLI